MYTILIADPELYAVGVFKTKEEAQECVKKMKLPGDSLVIEIMENSDKAKGTEVPRR